jgi:hypothetical protein
VTSNTNNLTHLRQSKHFAQQPSHRHLSHRKASLQASRNPRQPTISRNNLFHKHKHNGASRHKSTRGRQPPPILRPPRPQPKRHTRHPTTPPRPQHLTRPRPSLLARRRRRPRRQQHQHPPNLRTRHQTNTLTLTHPLLPPQLYTPTLSSARTSRRSTT